MGLNSVSDPLIQTLFRIRVDRSPFHLDSKQSNQIRVERNSAARLGSDSPVRHPPPAMNILFSCPRAPRSLDQCFQNGCHGHCPTLPSMAKVSQRACGFCCRYRMPEEVKLVSQTRLLGIIIDDSLSWAPRVDSLESARKLAAKWCFTSYVQAIDPHGKKAILCLSDSARFGVCCFSNHPVHADWSTRSTFGAPENGRSMPGRCSSPRRCLTTDRNLNLNWLSYLIVGPYCDNCSLWPPSDAVINSLLRRYSWRNLVFMSRQHGTPARPGRQQGPFNHFSRRSWLVVSLSRTEHLSCGTCFPGRCKPPVPC